MRDREMLPNRRSVRLRDYDYAGPGTIFFTVCTEGRRHLFGSIRDGSMHSNWFGEVVSEEWEQTLIIRPEIICHAFVVMPNHLHGLITIDPQDDARSATRKRLDGDARADCHLPLHARRAPRSVATMVSGFKGAVTRRSKADGHNPAVEIWQRGFHEHVVRNDEAFETIKVYIENNPARWHVDTFYSDPQPAL